MELLSSQHVEEDPEILSPVLPACSPPQAPSLFMKRGTEFLLSLVWLPVTYC